MRESEREREREREKRGEREERGTHIEESVSLIVNLIAGPPSLHPLALEEVVCCYLLVSSRQLVKGALVSITHGQGHGTEGKVHRP